ncbi:MAG: rhomboid family intramembrane serine protease [Planctomycetota bacterium]
MPIVNYLLIAANVLVFLAVTLPMSGAAVDLSDPAAQSYLQFLSEQYGRRLHPVEVMGQISSYDLFVFEHGFRPAHGSLQTMFTSMFLHGGFMHLAGNMLFLWIYGDNVEHRLGRVPYLIAYLLTGVAATLFFAAFDLSSNVPMVGASGAISGVLGFYFLFFPRNTVNVFVALFPILVDVVTIRARFVLGAYLIVDNIFPAIFSSGAGGVAHGAHIGGFIAGLAAAWGIERFDWFDGRAAGGAQQRPLQNPFSRKPRNTPVHEGPGYRGRPGADSASAGASLPRARISKAISQGRIAEAAQIYFESAEESGAEPVPADGLVLGRWLAENGHPTAALTVFRRVIKSVPTGSVGAWAHVGAGLVQLQDLSRPTAAYQHFLDAIDLDPDGEAARTARAGLKAIGDSGTA